MTQTRPLKTNLFNRNADLLHGPIFKNLFLFMLPILVSNLFQQLYNTVDTMIVGNVLGDTALAAIGSCGSIYELLVGFGIGIGNGLSIVAARSYGAQDEDLLKRTVAGALVIGLCASFVITTAGFFGLRPLLQLLDTPGILWPKFEDQQVGLRLALIGAIKDEILNIDELALELIAILTEHYPGVLHARYEVEEDQTPANIIEQIAVKRNCIQKGNELDYTKAANLLLEEFRSGKLGKITLEFPVTVA